MKPWKKYAAGLLFTAGLASQTPAQVPAVTATPVAAPAVVIGPPDAPQNLWSNISLTPEQQAERNDKLCNTALGQMLNNGLKPASTLSSGLVPSLCPPINSADLAKSADTAEVVAAHVKADETAAKARREAVRFLGTVDCHYWPEAQAALVNALRGDHNEDIRLEAALSLNRGCCCSKMIIKALVICVSGTDEDGFPTERSERVRATAHVALEHCLACYTQVIPVAPEVKKKEDNKEIHHGETRPDQTPAKLTQPMMPAEFYQRTQLEPREEIIAESKHVLAYLQPVVPQAQLMAAPLEGSSNSVHEIAQHASGGTSSLPAATTVRDMPPKPAIAAIPITPAPVAHDSLPVLTRPESCSPAISLPSTPAKVTLAEKSAPRPPLASAINPPVPTTPAPTTPSLPPFAEKPNSLPPLVLTSSAPVAPPATVATPSIQLVQATEKVTPATPTPSPTTKPVAAAAATAGSNGMDMTLGQVLTTLKESPHPEYREWAAENLATVDGWTNPDVVQALANALRIDQTASVRAACVRSLGRMRCGTLVATRAVQAAKTDPDALVRREADLAIQLVSGIPTANLTMPSGR